MRPTNNLRWKEAEATMEGPPVAETPNWPENGPNTYKLQQLWTGEFIGEEDEWRDIEIYHGI